MEVLCGSISECLKKWRAMAQRPIKQWQISDVLCNAGKPCGLQSVCLYGGTSKGPQVLDEADRMLDMGFEPEVRSILSQTCSDLAQSVASFCCITQIYIVLKSIIRPTETVAIGVLKSTDPSEEVEGKELGHDHWEVHVRVPVKPNESLIRSYGLVKTIRQAIGAHVAWPALFVILQVMGASREYLYK